MKSSRRPSAESRDPAERRSQRTARRKAAGPVEKTLARLEILRDAFDAAPFCVWARDPGGRVILMNRLAVEVFGDIHGTRIEDLELSPDLAEAWRAANRRAFSGESVRETVDFLIGGDVRRCVNIVTPLRFGKRIRGILGFLLDITEQQRTEDALRTSDALLRAVTESADDAIFVKDAGRRYTFLNPAAVRMIGRPRNEIFGRTPEEVFDEAGARAARAADDEAFAGRVCNVQSRMTLGGCERVLHAVQSAIPDAGGRISAICGIVRDVTSRVETDEALRASEARFKMMVDALPILAVRFDAEGGIVGVNTRWIEYTGRGLEESRGARWVELLHPDDVARVRRIMGSALRARATPEVEYRLRRASDGQYRWHIARAFPVRDAQGRVLEWIGAAADIHAQKSAEEDLERQVAERTQALRVNELRLQRILDSSRDGYWEWDVPRNRVFLSNRFRAMIGWPPGGATVTREAVWRTLHPGDEERMRAVVERAIGVGAPSDMYELEHRHVRPSGDVVWVHARGKVTERDAEGRAVSVSGVATDITERKHAEIEIARRSDQLVRLASELTMAEHRERCRLAEIVHEELQQHLVGAQMMGLSILDGQAPEIRPQMERLLQAVKAAIGETKRITLGLAPPVHMHESLGHMIEGIARDMGALHGLSVAVRCPERLGTVPEAVVVLLYTAIRELLLNVVKHSGTRAARVRARRAGGRVVVEVSDRGAGCAAARGAGDAGPGGFGLFSIRERAELLGGRLVIESTAGRGTVTRLEVPVSSPAAVRAPGRRAGARKGSARGR